MTFLCVVCGVERRAVNVRPWPGESFVIAECECCGNTQSIEVDPLADTLPPESDTPTDPDASTAAALLSDREPILSAERDTRGVELILNRESEVPGG